MATSIYKKIGFEDRQDTKPDTYLVDGVPKTIEKDNSGLVQAGTNLNQENLDHMEEGILQNSRNINELDKKIGNHAELIEKNTSQLDDITTDVGEKTTLKTTDKTSLVNAVNELFTNANNGKTLISSVVGSPLLATDTFQQQHDKIQTLLNTFATNLTAKEQQSVGTEGLKSLVDKVAKINVGKRWARGTCISNVIFYSNGNRECFIEIRDLKFEPTLVLAYSTDYKAYSDTTRYIGFLTKIGTDFYESHATANGTPELIKTTAQKYFLTDIIKLPINVYHSDMDNAKNKQFTWIAYE